MERREKQGGCCVSPRLQLAYIHIYIYIKEKGRKGHLLNVARGNIFCVLRLNVIASRLSFFLCPLISSCLSRCLFISFVFSLSVMCSLAASTPHPFVRSHLLSLPTPLTPSPCFRCHLHAIHLQTALRTLSSLCSSPSPLPLLHFPFHVRRFHVRPFAVRRSPFAVQQWCTHVCVSARM